MKDELVLRTFGVSQTIARSLNLEIVVGERFQIMRGQQQLYVTDTVHGIHGFLVGWNEAKNDKPPEAYRQISS